MVLYLMKNWLTILALLISSIALVISIRSCQAVDEGNRIARESNEIARKALNQSDATLVKTQRPYLNVTPEQFNKSSYLKVVSEADRVVVTFQFKLTNAGQSPAKSILLSEVKFYVIDLAGVQLEEIPIKPFPITLGPEESQDLTVKVALRGMAPDKLVTLLESDKGSIDVQFTLFYRGFHDESQYKTSLRVRAKKSRVITLYNRKE